jgi:hypothetical protein
VILEQIVGIFYVAMVVTRLVALRGARAGRRQHVQQPVEQPVEQHVGRGDGT